MTDTDYDEVIKKEMLFTFKNGKTKKTPICIYRSHRSCIIDSDRHDDRIRADEKKKIDAGVQGIKKQIEDLYNLNASISAVYLTEQEVPTLKTMTTINKRLGGIIKRLRDETDKL